MNYTSPFGAMGLFTDTQAPGRVRCYGGRLRSGECRSIRNRALYDSSGLGSFTVNYNSSTAKFGPQTMTYGVSYPYSFTQVVAAGIRLILS